MTEQEQLRVDLLTFGLSIERDGKRVDPMTFYVSTPGNEDSWVRDRFLAIEGEDEAAILWAFEQGRGAVVRGEFARWNPYLPVSEQALYEAWNCGFDWANRGRGPFVPRRQV